jgi:hypothetical protein
LIGGWGWGGGGGEFGGSFSATRLFEGSLLGRG